MAATNTTPDATLLRTARRFRAAYDDFGKAMDRQGQATGGDLPQRVQSYYHRRIGRHRAALRHIPASTIEGIKAKAGVVAVEEGWLWGREPDTLLQSLLRDLGVEAQS